MKFQTMFLPTPKGRQYSVKRNTIAIAEIRILMWFVVSEKRKLKSEKCHSFLLKTEVDKAIAPKAININPSQYP